MLASEDITGNTTMQHKSTTKSTTKSRTGKTRNKRYSAREVAIFKMCSQYESEQRKEYEKRQYEEEMRRYERYLQRQAPKALPVLNFTPEDIAAILELAEQYREQHRTGAA